MNSLVKTITKGTIIGSCMFAFDEMVNKAADPYSTKKRKLPLTIAGVSIGFVIGREVADEVVWALSDAIEAYGKEKD